MTKAVTYSIFIFIIVSHMGCAGPRSLGSIPTESQDFLLSKEELKSKFPEIAVYEEENVKPFGYCTPLNELISVWGNPDEEKYDLMRFHGPAAGAIAVGTFTGGGPIGAIVGAGIVLGISPKPFQKYTWFKGNYRILVETDTSIFCRYRTRLLTWEWSTIDDKETSSKKTLQIEPDRQ